MKANERARSVLRREFEEFAKGPVGAVPAELSANVLGQILRELNPSARKVFAKVTLIHFLVGTLSLTFCPQFGVSLTSSMGLMPYLMRFGEAACMIGCGAMFTGVSLLVASFALRLEELRVLRRHSILQIGSLATLSLGAFLCLGAEVIAGLGVVWIAAALVGGVVSLQAGWHIKRLVLRSWV